MQDARILYKLNEEDSSIEIRVDASMFTHETGASACVPMVGKESLSKGKVDTDSAWRVTCTPETDFYGAYIQITKLSEADITNFKND